jgi:hypothetical protein
MRCYGAGDGNRTHATSLEGWSSTIELHPRKSGVPREIRTPDLLIRSQTLYPAELWAHKEMERTTGIEPATLALARRCSTAEPRPQIMLP